MGDGWCDLAEALGRACGALKTVCHVRNQNGQWEAHSADQRSATPSVSQDRLGSIAADRFVDDGIKDGTHGVFLALRIWPSPPLVLWLGFDQPPDAARLRALVDLVEQVASASADDRQLSQHRRREAVDRMVSGVAHELNNPLQTVVGNAEMLANMKLTDAARRRAQRVLSGARRCQEVVDGLLKLKRKRRDLGQTVVLEEVVRAAARTVESEFSELRVSLKIQVRDPIPEVNGNAEDLAQALENIIRNAFQAVGQTADPEVGVRVEPNGGTVRVEVEDNGAGMTPKVRGRALEPFFTTRGVGAGKGLGLSIALGIVEEHGGQISLEQQDVGTVVAVDLPVTSRSRS